MENKKEPFGIKIAAKVACLSISDNVAPLSTILTNLFILAKSNKFPENLTTDYFVKQHSLDDGESIKTIKNIMDSIRKPDTNVNELIQSTLNKIWIKKVKESSYAHKKDKNKNKSIIKKSKKPTSNKSKVGIQSPPIVIKKQKRITAIDK